jgi:hypothetical protein
MGRRAGCLRRLMMQHALSALQLPADMNLSFLEVHVGLGKTQDLASAKPENENQDIGGVELHSRHQSRRLLIRTLATSEKQLNLPGTSYGRLELGIAAIVRTAPCVPATPSARRPASALTRLLFLPDCSRHQLSRGVDMS